MTDYIEASFLKNHVCEVVINRPAKKNAINLAMYEALLETLKQAEADNDIRVLLLCGAEGNFTAGNDLADLASFAADPGSILSPNNPVVRFMRALDRFPKPVVAAVEGVAVGIGVTLLLHCDLVYAANSARLSMPFIDLGLCPEYASSVLIPRLAGYPKAAEWMMLGDAFGGAEAQSAGLVNRVCNDALATARQQCERLAQKPPAALRATKRLLRQSHGELDGPMQRELTEFGAALKGPEFGEALKAFFEKRPPDFSEFS
ncbi:enoyl-CoA hydratase [Teredinibacter turnerae]|uniref:enoyl-CoA hydratase n=1 Tax=Teredinibacter turnerae TaxID=2426 RepID=UPI000360E5B2|nr:enoyl-CoA hydratase [Teredinibacter turnerae]